MQLEAITLGPLPALAAGQGAPLLYLGGLLPVAGVDDRLARRTAEFSARPFTDLRRVLFTNRRPGLPTGLTMAGLAAEHADAVRALGVGPVDVVGVSTGGSIAQQLAADHPDVVRRLVLIGTGCRLSPLTRRMQAEVAAEIRRGHVDRALAALALGVVHPAATRLAGPAGPLMSRYRRRLGDLSDLATTIEAEDGFELRRAAGTIRAATLILAGTRDRFYPRPLLEETRELIPGSVLQLVPRRGHVAAVADRRTTAAVREFLLQPEPVTDN